MNINQLLKQAQSMQKQVKELQDKLANNEYEGKAGGQLVVVNMTGDGKLLNIKIDPSIVKLEEKDILEDLIVAAIGDAKRKIEEASQSALSGVNMPAGFKMPF
ncbi:MAG: YbaB/EbfC family nucleoid-associated protein [Rickettsiaceae bacterium]|nr:YbaB/EbfC family nucleoid-associated protein [Rickettsiaceae bacterium]